MKKLMLFTAFLIMFSMADASTTSSTTTSTLCDVSIKSDLDGYWVCTENMTNCGVYSCLNNTYDHFVYYKYYEFNVFNALNDETILWFVSFMATTAVLLITVGIVSFGVFHVVIRRWEK